MYKYEILVNKDDVDIVSEVLFAIGASSVSETIKNNSILVSTMFNEDVLNKLNSLFQKKYDIIATKLEQEDWINKWTFDFKDIKLSENIRIIPEEYNFDDFNEKVIIKINPQNAFGAGSHATTKLCSKILDKIFNKYNINNYELSALDIGTGNGILSLILNKFGVKNIDAFDFDPGAIDMAQINSTINNISEINFFVDDINKFSKNKTYSLVIANLLTVLLEKNFNKIYSLLENNGYLILSGISEQWDDEIKTYFTRFDLKILEDLNLDNWKAFLLHKKC